MTSEQFKRSKRVEAVANRLGSKTGWREIHLVCPARTDEPRGTCSSRVSPAVAAPKGSRGLPFTKQRTVNRARSEPRLAPASEPARLRTTQETTNARSDAPHCRSRMTRWGCSATVLRRGRSTKASPGNARRSAPARRRGSATRGHSSCAGTRSACALLAGNADGDVARSISARRQTRRVCAAAAAVSERRVPSLRARPATMVGAGHDARPAAR